MSDPKPPSIVESTTFVKSNFDSHAIDEKGMGAGIIPVSTNGKGETVFLLGRERFVSQWKGSCRWSGFEGSRKEGETLQQTACREFEEESLCCVMSKATAALCLEEQNYIARIVLKIAQTHRATERYHATYVVKTDHDDTLSEVFESRRSDIEYLDGLVQEWKYTRPKWMSDMLIGPWELNEEGRISILCKTTSTTWLAPPYVSMELLEENDIVRFTTSCQYTHQWLNTREKVQRVVNNMKSQYGFVCMYDSKWKCIQNVTILADYLEKDQIRWWTKADLQLVLENKGNLGVERFRPYFLPVLQTLLQLDI